MSNCFVIQPFDGAKFDKRYNDIYKPAIEAAGIEAYRVDKDPGVSIPIEAIERGIKQSIICLADITADNPNVWYELGYAFALNKQVIMVCSEERTGKKYPFDIQHRSIIPYMADSPSDFELLRENLTKKIIATIEQAQKFEDITEASLLSLSEGLSQSEVLALAIIASEVELPGESVSVYITKRGAEAAGLTNLGFNLALRKLKSKDLIELKEEWENNSPYMTILLNDQGWDWIEENESKFTVQKQNKIKVINSQNKLNALQEFNEDIPF
jgi:hypothetical protein